MLWQFPVLNPEPAMARPVDSPPRPTRLNLRAQSREGIDTSVSLHLIQASSWLQGSILDLSLNGCRIRTDEFFPVGVYTRVETEFRLDGLPFRLDGVLRGIQDGDWSNIGIRFLEMSSRKREQVEQLIEEIREQKEAGLVNPSV